MPGKSLKWNVIANMGGRLWASLLAILAVPIFIRALGTEAYGLVGLFVSLQMICDFFDLGLAGTATREVARNLEQGRSTAENKRLVRTFELIYWTIALCSGLVIFSGAGWIATNWVHVERMSPTEVQFAFAVMAVSFAARWPTLLYGGVLRGMQEQVLLNGIIIASASLRVLGALAVVIWISPTITAFLLTQAFAYILEVAATGLAVWRILNRQSTSAARFDPQILRRVWRYALSFNVAGTLGVILAGADRIVISKSLPLAQLGYYAIASTAAGALLLISHSLGLAAFPRFSAQAASEDKERLARDYRRVMNASVCLSACAGLAIFFFSREILALWTQNADVVRETSAALSLLALANLLFSVQNPSYLLLLATGHTKIPLAVTIFSVALSLPAMLVAIPIWGITAAAALWLLQNLIYTIVYTLCAHRLVLKKSFLTTFAQDVLVYLLLGCFWIGGARLLTSSNERLLSTLLILSGAVTLYFLTALPLLRARGLWLTFELPGWRAAFGKRKGDAVSA